MGMTYPGPASGENTGEGAGRALSSRNRELTYFGGGGGIVGRIYGKVRQALVPGQTPDNRVQSNPGDSVRGPADRSNYYARMFGYYTNDAFALLDEAWKKYRAQQKQYRFHRGVYNPTWEICEWYADAIYGGMLAVPGREVPKGAPNAIPLAEDTNTALAEAIKQFWSWSNMQENIQNFARIPSIVGGVLTEIIDDVPGGKVMAQNWWPHLIPELVLDAAGNVKVYAVKYQYEETVQLPLMVTMGDPNGVGATQPQLMRTAHTFMKRVDDEYCEYYRDGYLYDYTGEGAIQEHPYGFAPAVWNTYQKVASEYGEPALWASLTQVDEVDELASMAHDNLAKLMRAPVLLKSKTSLASTANRKKRSDDQLEEDPTADKERIPILRVDENSSMESIPQEVGDTLLYIQAMLDKIAERHPETRFWAKVMEMSQATGPGMDRAMGGLKLRYYSIMGRMDLRLMRLQQMAVTIAAIRRHQKIGGWAEDTAEQKLFDPFTVDSYKNGDLNHVIEPRKLIPTTEEEEWDIRLARATALAAEIKVGVPEEIALKDMDFTKAEIDEMAKLKQEAQQQQTQQQIDTIKQQQLALGVQQQQRQAGTQPGGTNTAGADSTPWQDQ